MNPTVPTLVLALTVAFGPPASGADRGVSLRDGLEHEATRGLAAAQQAQARVFNPREHTARRGLATASCTSTLQQAWADLGHFSDAYESFLLRSGRC